MSRFPILLPLLLASLFLALGPGCEEAPFEPLQESDLHFSVFGFLDAGADTQFVRVSRLRTQLAPEAAALEAEVVLEHLATGTRHVLRDSVFHYAGGGQAHNFWTAAPLVAGDRYRFTVTGPAGETTSAFVTLPDSFPRPEVVQRQGAPPTIRVPGVARLADVLVTYHVEDFWGQRHAFSFSHVRAAAAYQGGFLVIVTEEEDLETVRRNVGSFSLRRLLTEAHVSAAGPDWPELEEGEETQALVNQPTNLEHGVGFLGGVYTQRIVW